MGPSTARRGTVAPSRSLGMTFWHLHTRSRSDERHKISSTIRSQHRAGRVSMKLLGPHTPHAPRRQSGTRVPSCSSQGRACVRSSKKSLWVRAHGCPRTPDAR
ncbi:hypothetical protein GQ607_011102 [Colletotrichum asianum]|uniref:Uncharacterized protein n=1 Tax=Colletotrichum asianum TaxID=702518 RepID=A0A8H3W6S6_9PEZI|nr:hypothetical protein GQ607_011102 [Colletotrichum asianum]